MIGKSYFLLSLLQAGLAQNWEADTPREVTAQEGSCAQIPCHYRYPLDLADQHRDGIWFNNEKVVTSSIAFHSRDHSQESPHFHHRTRLSGHLKDGDCSLIINNIRRQDAGPYLFRVEFEGKSKYSYKPVTQLHVSEGELPTAYFEVISPSDTYRHPGKIGNNSRRVLLNTISTCPICP
ncbi:myeloid cell surface antigen CD33-like [Rhincodon typus]|uniref:myeloid cell surface antigen CD33-like n=1 Tax=Rhincodon typus TaxID=259920 RepID=UPI00202FF662|nr:myeloid cell surface antigen CD33-like [Rhincodon typus]